MSRLQGVDRKEPSSSVFVDCPTAATEPTGRIRFRTAWCVRADNPISPCTQPGLGEAPATSGARERSRQSIACPSRGPRHPQGGDHAASRYHAPSTDTQPNVRPIIRPPSTNSTSSVLASPPQPPISFTRVPSGHQLQSARTTKSWNHVFFYGHRGVPAVGPALSDRTPRSYPPPPRSTQPEPPSSTTDSSNRTEARATV